MADATPKPLIFNDWNNGMADSPDLGVGLLQDVSIDTVPGALMPNYKPVVMSPIASSAVITWDYTVNNGTGTVTGSFPQLKAYSAIQLTNAGGAVPAGLTASTAYFITNVSGNTFQLASTLANALAGTPISTSGDGSGTTTMATVNFGTAMHSVMNPTTGYVFVLDSNGQLWYSPGGSAPLYMVAGQTYDASPIGNGLVGFNVGTTGTYYIFVFRNGAVDILNASGDTQLQDPVGQSAWTTGWGGVSPATPGTHYAMVATNNIIYFCDGPYIGQIVETVFGTFNPGTPSTYAGTTNKALGPFPAGEVAAHIEVYTNSILIAGATYNYIYPWDRVSLGYGYPWFVPEKGVYRLKNIGNIIYILAGARGNVYQSSGYLVTLALKIPQWVTQSVTSTIVAWGGVGQKNGHFIFGVGTSGAGNGTWSMDPSTTSPWMNGLGGKTLLDSQLVNGRPVTTLLIPAEQGEDFSEEFYYLGGGDAIGTNGEFSAITTDRYAAYGTALYQSGLRAVGNKIVKAKYSRLEVQLNQPGASGNTIRVSWRSSSSGSWTVMAGGSTNGVFVADGTVTSFTQDIGLHDLENIQIQVELLGAGSGSNALELMSVILYP